ncbi:sirohydrochlorin chelatase [Humibacter ginsenosidimutans]|uniref:Cobalamin biosynthesis protein CbiX n=1 Tax=Humibacter ginsenosidimutans TaxID=2599293 RepID=A0A5B8M2K9_9MICO|nr:CbiX/SirB N-terminal domain-containing protein [Humibacter ginsenosidimutans]QDZ14486.1 cobalamin biosynthesis protein CbiX [Humibacter ginsenosidimutans]
MTTTLFAASHGTSSPHGRLAVSRLVDAVARAVSVPVVPGHVDVEQPDVASAIADSAGTTRAVIVPLLLSAGYHVHVDLAEAALTAAVPTLVTPALGADERLVDVVVMRLAEAGYDRTDSVVLAAAGSSDPRAVDDCRATGRMLAARLGANVTVGFLSASAPSLADAVAEARRDAPNARVVVATYLLAPGYFFDLVGRVDADVVCAPLLTPTSTPRQLVEIVIDRAREATAGPR